jgi:hypothetical protein
MSPPRQGVLLWEISPTQELPQATQQRCRELLTHLLLKTQSRIKTCGHRPLQTVTRARYDYAFKNFRTCAFNAFSFPRSHSQTIKDVHPACASAAQDAASRSLFLVIFFVQ